MSDITDSFNRANGALGTTNTGETWTTAGTWAISSNQAGSSTTGGLASVNAWSNHGQVSVKIAAMGTGTYPGGVIARKAPGGYSIELYWGASGMFLAFNGVSGPSQAIASTPCVVGDTIALRCVGSDIRAYRNGVEVLAITDSTLLTGTEWGIHSANTAARFDDFAFTDLSPPKLPYAAGLAGAYIFTTPFGADLSGVSDVPAIAPASSELSGAYNFATPFGSALSGAYNFSTPFGSALSGVSDVPTIAPVVVEIAGTYRYLIGRVAEVTGTSDVPAIAPVVAHLSGTCDVPATVPVVAHLSGTYKHFVAYGSELSGTYDYAASFGAELSGAYDYAASFGAELSGAYNYPITYTQHLVGLYRVANDALARYEMYVGVDGPPDLSAAPTVTGTALPLSTSALTAGHTYHFVTRHRNRWGLASGNVATTAIVVDADGLETLPAPAAPANVVLSQFGPSALLTAEYYYGLDGDAAADAFVVYVRTDGTAPNLATDAPTIYSFFPADGVARLEHSVPYLSHGDVVKAVVVLRRTGTSGALSVDGTPSAIVTLTVNLTPTGVPAVSQGLFGRSLGQA
jgi:hypothetical protein